MPDRLTDDFLQRISERIANDRSVTLTPDEQSDLLRLLDERDLDQVDLEAQNEQLRKLSRELEASRDEFHDLFETAPVAFVTLSQKGIVERINTRAAELLGAVKRPIVGQGFSTFVHPDDWGLYYGNLKKIARTKTPSNFDVRLTGDREKPIHLHVQAAPKREPDGRFKHWRLVLFDISNLRRRENELKEVYEQLNLASQAAELGIWNYDLDQGTSQWNAQLYRLLGLEPRPGPESSERFFDSIHPDDRMVIVTKLARLLEQGGDQINLEFRIERPDGKRCWLASRGRILRDRRGRPKGISGINFDITARKQAEENVHLAQLQLAGHLAETERVNEELSQYAYAVSHDLKEPLRAVRNYASFLYDDLAGTLDAEQKKYLEGLKTAVDQGDALIEDLLTFSVLGQTQPEIWNVRINDLIEEIRNLLSWGNDTEITVQAEWPAFYADRVLLKQILQNLISNGIKFNRRSPKRIEIGCRSTARDEIEIFVRDNGIGIDSKYHDQIFRIFQRLHTNREYPGTGIGLAIVNKAAAKLGGSVRMESTVGQGTIFFVCLPLE